MAVSLQRDRSCPASGNVDLDSNVRGATYSGSAVGNFAVDAPGPLFTGQITADTINLTSVSGGPPSDRIQVASGFLTANTVTLVADRVTVDTQASALNINSLEFIVVNNDSPNLTMANLTAGASDNITFTTTGNASGVVANGLNADLTASTGTLSATSNATNQTTASAQTLVLGTTSPTIDATSTDGGATVTANTPSLDLTGSSTNGTLNVTNTTGDIVSASATGPDVILDANGALTGAASGPMSVTATGATVNLNVTPPTSRRHRPLAI